MEKQTVEVVMDYVFIMIAIAIIATRVVWRMPLPNRRWYSYSPSAEQLFSDADEKITRRVNDEIK